MHYPFRERYSITNRSYSLHLQRAITDFGSDCSFSETQNKIEEHYRIKVPESSIRCVVLAHAQQMDSYLSSLNPQEGFDSRRAPEVVVGQTDGTMIPIVKTKPYANEDSETDRRKNKELFYREARLSLAHKIGEVDPVYRATLGSTDEVGEQLQWCTLRVGADDKSSIHCVGDGAKWITEQVEKRFGAHGHYLIDFFHLCEYLYAAAARIFTDTKQRTQWVKEQKLRMKQSKTQEVLDALSKHITEEHDKDDPVVACHRYISNRPNQFDYKKAIENDLPIGSGKVESGHRSVIQKRLKIPGAWWKEENAQSMLALRTIVVNDNWDQYWEAVKKVA